MGTLIMYLEDVYIVEKRKSGQCRVKKLPKIRKI